VRPLPRARPLISDSQRLAITAVGLLVVLLLLVEVAVIGEELAFAWTAIAVSLLGLEYALLGWLAWARRPGNLMGPLILLTALSCFGANLLPTLVPVLAAASLIVTATPVALAIHLLHAFPSGHLRGWSRPVMVATYFVALVLQAPSYLFTSDPAPYDVLRIADRPDLVHLGIWATNVAGVVVLLATAVVLLMRLRGLDPARRRVMGPLLTYGYVSVGLQPVALHVLPRFGVSQYGVDWTQLALLAGIPIAFVLCLLLGGFGRTTGVHELGVWLGSRSTERTDLVRALERTLGDSSVAVWFWVRGGYVDAEGVPVAHTAAATGASGERGLVEVELGGERIGAISYDSSLLTDARPIETAGRVIALAVDRERLTAELLVVRTSLRQTLAKVVETGDLERRRIARDLHDGLQSRLVVLGMRASQIESDPTATVSVVGAAAELRQGLDVGVDELRRLVAGVMPATLLERGLYAATEDFVAGLPILAELDLSGASEDLPAAVESAAYFMLTEAVTNTLKHARADRLTVRLDRIENVLRIEVRDNGVGGATGARLGGLTGLADRIGALGGAFDVQSDPGRGTCLVAEVPCGSS
jgi:signal transduction histidine kinase